MSKGLTIASSSTLTSSLKSDGASTRTASGAFSKMAALAFSNARTRRSSVTTERPAMTASTTGSRANCETSTLSPPRPSPVPGITSSRARFAAPVLDSASASNGCFSDPEAIRARLARRSSVSAIQACSIRCFCLDSASCSCAEKPTSAGCFRGSAM